MGTMADREIAAWQKRVGVEEATGERALLLNELSKAAYDLIIIIERERSGIRDGDGHWHGSDVLGGQARELVELRERLDDFDKSQRVLNSP